MILLDNIVCHSHILCSLSCALDECNVCFIYIHFLYVGSFASWRSDTARSCVPWNHASNVVTLPTYTSALLCSWCHMSFGLLFLWSFPDTSTQVCLLNKITCSLDSCLCYGISLTVWCFSNTTSFMALCFHDTIYHLVSFPRWLRELSVFSFRRRDPH